MSLLGLSGTAAFDFWDPYRSTPPEAPTRKSWSAQITDAELVGIEIPEPAEWEARGRFYPNIRVLENSTKDWIYENGLYRPPDTVGFGGFWPGITVGPGTPPIPLTSTVQFNGIWIQPGGGAHITGIQITGPTAPPRAPLPVEKRGMPVIGYRSWKFQSVYKLGRSRKGCLLPLNQSYGPWVKGKNTAQCQAHQKHTPADEHCFCGFYVMSTLDAAESWAQGMADDTIVGAVMGWGRVVQHGEEGWRAQYAKIIALLDCQFSKAQSENTQVIAKTYELEVKSRPQLEALVSEFGEPFQKLEIET